jgi:hypothetical protein
VSDLRAGVVSAVGGCSDACREPGTHEAQLEVVRYFRRQFSLQLRQGLCRRRPCHRVDVGGCERQTQAGERRLVGQRLDRGENRAGAGDVAATGEDDGQRQVLVRAALGPSTRIGCIQRNRTAQCLLGLVVTTLLRQCARQQVVTSRGYGTLASAGNIFRHDRTGDAFRGAEILLCEQQQLRQIRAHQRAVDRRRLGVRLVHRQHRAQCVGRLFVIRTHAGKLQARGQALDLLFGFRLQAARFLDALRVQGFRSGDVRWRAGRVRDAHHDIEFVDGRASRPGRASLRTPWLEAKIHRLGQWSIARPVPGIALLLLLTAPLLAAALHAQFDYERQRYFAAADPVKLADQLLGERLGGFNFLDVAVTAPAPGGLMDTAALTAIADLKRSISALPEVTKVAAIDDYVSLMHQALTGAEPGVLPQEPGAPAQYMFLYESSAAPDDFRQRIDYDHQHALLRAQLATDRYSATQPAVQALDALLADWQAQSGLAAVVSGRVAVNEGWMSVLAQNHFRGLGLAVLLVFAVTAIAMRGFGPALLAMVPVGGGILFIYAIMGAFRIDIAPATSMSAAIATGLGVDFGIHLIAYLRKRLAAGASLTEALDERFALVARACFYSALALGVALAVICLSSAPPLRWFGVLVGAGALGSLLGALLLIPAVLSLTGPALLGRSRGNHV